MAAALLEAQRVMDWEDDMMVSVLASCKRVGRSHWGEYFAKRPGLGAQAPSKLDRRWKRADMRSRIDSVGQRIKWADCRVVVVVVVVGLEREFIWGRKKRDGRVQGLDVSGHFHRQEIEKYRSQTAFCTDSKCIQVIKTNPLRSFSRFFTTIHGS